MSLNIACLISGGGTNLQSIIDAIDAGEIDGKLTVVISNNEEAYGLKRAEKYDIKNYFIDGPDADEQMLAIMAKEKIDLIVLAGYLRILSEQFVKTYKKRIINIHPSLIPKYCGKGYYGENVHQAVLENNETYSGATVHFVDEGIDTGEIIYQKRVKVKEDDTVETLAERVLKVEHEILVKAVKDICAGNILKGVN